MKAMSTEKYSRQAEYMIYGYNTFWEKYCWKTRQGEWKKSSCVDTAMEQEGVIGGKGRFDVTKFGEIGCLRGVFDGFTCSPESDLDANQFWNTLT